MTVRRTLVLLAFMLLAAPTAVAQLPVPSAGLVATSLAATVGAPGSPIPSETTIRVPYRVEYTVEGPAAGELRVRVIVAGFDPLLGDTIPGWSLMTEPAEHIVQGQPGLATTHVLEGVIAVRHDGTPLALTPHEFTLFADAPGDGAALAPAETSVAFQLEADWRPGLYAVLAAPRLMLDERGGADTVNAEITNTGNAPVKVRAEGLRAPTGCTARLASAPTMLVPNERSVLSIGLDCERRWNAGSVTVRLEHGLASDEARTGTPVEPQWDIVPVDWDDVTSGLIDINLGTTGARTYGDEPVRNDASWGATLLVPMALLVAALLLRRR